MTGASSAWMLMNLLVVVPTAALGHTEHELWSLDEGLLQQQHLSAPTLHHSPVSPGRQHKSGTTVALASTSERGGGGDQRFGAEGMFQGYFRAGATEDYGRRGKESVTRIPETDRLTQLPNSNRRGGHGALTPETDRLTQLQGSIGAAGAEQRSVWADSLLHSGFLNDDSEVTVTTDPTMASFLRNIAWEERFVLEKPFSSHPLNPSLNHPLNHQLNHPLASGASGPTADGAATAKSGGLFGLAPLSHTHHLAGNEKKVAEGKKSMVGEDLTRLNTFLGDHFSMVFPQFSDEELEHNILFLHDDSLQASHLHSTDLPPLKRNSQPPDLQDSPFLPAEDLQDSPFLPAEDLQDSPFLPAEDLQDSPFLSAEDLQDSPFLSAEEGKQLPEKRSGWSLSLNSADDLQLLSVLNKNILSLDTAQDVQLPDLQSVEMVFNV